MSVFKDDQTTYTGNLTVLGSLSVGGSLSVTGSISIAGNPIVAATPITNSLGADVALVSTGGYFDGPSVAQGSTGTWFASGQVTLADTATAESFFVKLWDGTTVINSCYITTVGANLGAVASLSGYIVSPAGNIKISVRDPNTITGKILFNTSGNSKDSTISAVRIA